MGITENSLIGYTDPLKRTNSADAAIKQYTQTDTRDLAQAFVRCTPKKYGQRTWHTGGSNPTAPEHLTVEFIDSKGQHVTTKHIDRNGNAC